jgi:hypothetical protein
VTVWLVRAHCGDYYCGCGGGHLVGVYSTEALASDAARFSYRCEDVYGKDAGATRHRRWEDPYVEAVEVDALPAALEYVGSSGREVLA